MKFIKFAGSHINLFHVAEIGVKSFATEEKLLAWQREVIQKNKPNCWIRIADFIYREYFDTMTQANARMDEVIKLAND